MGDHDSADELLQSLSRPVDTLGHEIRNHLHGVIAQVALVRLDQTHIKEQGTRIESRVGDVSRRTDAIDDKVNTLEKTVLLRVVLLEQKIGPLEKIVYGLCTAVLVTVLGGILALVVR